MVICPKCGFPYDDDTNIVAARDVVCANCRWRGSSTQLLEVQGDLKSGIEFVQQLYKFLGEQISPQIAVKMVELGLLSSAKTPENLKKMAMVLSKITRATFRGIVESSMEEADGTAN